MELMVAGVISVLVGCGVYTLIRSSYDSQYLLMNQNNASCQARQAIDTLADNLRGLKTLSAATASDVTFTDNSGNTWRYWRNTSDSTLRYTKNAAPTGGTTLVQNVTSLAFTWWTYSGSTWSSSSAPGTLSSVGAVDISATALLNGSSRQISSSVKLRQVRLSNSNGF